MTSHPYLDQGLSILQARLLSVPSRSPFDPAVRPFVTISRQSCAGATTLGGRLVKELSPPHGAGGRTWALLDKDLLARALTQHNLPERLADFLPEDRVSEIQAVIGELVGLHPPLWEVERQVAGAIIELARIGGVILVGRAAHLLTQNLPGGFHVRLVASLPSRIRRMMRLQHCDEEAAAQQIERTDLARRRYVEAHFGQDIDDPCAYDLVLNTDRISPAIATQLVIRGLQCRLAAFANSDADG